MKHVVLTGATGFLGRHLLSRWQALGLPACEWTIVSRDAARAEKALALLLHAHVARFVSWDGLSPLPAEVFARAENASTSVIHLAGEPIAPAGWPWRWTPEVKQRIRDSRVQSTRRISEALRGLPSGNIERLVCGSAVGIYGSNRGDEILTESSQAGSGFLAEICKEWESEARQARASCLLLRTGIVLGSHGGMLQRVLTPFRLGLGGPLGGGRQWMSWIHVDDWVGSLGFLLQRPDITGPVNLTAPNPVTNADFTRALSSELRRPAFFRAPGFALRGVLGEMSELLLGGQRALPQKLADAGFSFRYPTIEAALRAELREGAA